MNSSSNLLWFDTLYRWCVVCLWLIFNINDNLIQQSPTFSLMETLMLPLSSCFFSPSPPLTSMENGTPPNNISPPVPLCYSQRLSCWILCWPIRRKNYSQCLSKILKISLAIGLVKISTICSFVPIYFNLVFISMTCSRKKWNLIGICFVLERITGLLELVIALLLSQGIGMGSSYFTCMSFIVCFIQRTWVQHIVVAIYFASGVDKDTEYCFLLN